MDVLTAAAVLAAHAGLGAVTLATLSLAYHWGGWTRARVVPDRRAVDRPAMVAVLVALSPVNWPALCVIGVPLYLLVRALR